MGRTLAYVDLFAGAGGLSLGLERAGFRLRHAVEINDHARATFAANRPRTAADKVSRDIRAIPPSTIPELVGGPVDLVAGGPPCQGFSEVGKRDGADHRNHLFLDFIRWVDRLAPRAAIFENVRGMGVTAGGKFLRAVNTAFAEIGYQVTSTTVTSARFGVPQLRRRILILAVRNGVPLPSLINLDLQPERAPTVMDAIGDLPALAAGESATGYGALPSTILQADLRGQAESTTEHKAVPHPPSLVEAIRHIGDGENRRSIPAHLQPKSGFHNSYARLRSDAPAVAITSNMAKPSSARCIHPFQHRGLTAREGARLQTFPDEYVFLGGDVAKRLQIGNAVPPYLAETIGYFLRKEVFGVPLKAEDLRRLAVMRSGFRAVADLKRVEPSPWPSVSQEVLQTA